MTERSDIGSMIEEELPKREDRGDAGERPLDEGEIEDLRTPAERAADRRRAPEPARAATAETAFSAPEADRTEKKESALERERKELADQYAHLRENANAADDGEKRNARSRDKTELVRRAIEVASRSDAKLSTDILKEGVAVATDKDTHIFGAGLRSVTEKMMAQPDLRGLIDNLLRSQPDADAALKALTKNIETRIAKMAKASEQRSRLYEGTPRAATETPRSPSAAAASPSEKKAVGDATKPFFEDVRRMMAQPDVRRKDEPKQQKKKRSWWDRLTGKKAA